jgi:hypothetical protein
MVVFKPVHEWGDYHRHICEVQVRRNGQICICSATGRNVVKSRQICGSDANFRQGDAAF